jgi:hypothetical protein
VIAWNGAAFDPVAGEWFFHGGGNTDYGGNEVYRFSFRDQIWRRLTQPSAYPPRTAARDAPPEQRCPYPLDGPPAMQTFSGKVFSPATRTLFVAPGAAFCPSGLGARDGGRGLWEFNPSETEPRGGLGPLKWRHLDLDLGIGGFPHAVGLGDGQLLIGGASVDVVFDPVRRAVGQSVGPAADQGDGTAVFDAKRGVVWLLNRSGLQRLQYRNGMLGQRVSVARDLPGGVTFASGIAVHEPTGKLVFWSGRNFTVTFDPANGQWELNEHASGPTARSGTVYNKWIYLPDHDVFAGYQNSDTGVFLYKLPASGSHPTTVSIQTIVDAAPPGSRIKVPPGLYTAGAIIRKPIAVDMAGVRVLAPAQGKAALVVAGVKGVVIENLKSSGLSGGGNLAGVRAEGAFDVTIRRAHIFDNEMGLLTSNEGGRLVIEDSLIEEVGHASSDLGHLVYAGAIDELVIRSSTLRMSRNFGHIVKSRAKRTVIERSFLLGMSGRDSRELDLPCGGEVIVRDSVIQKGADSDNAEMIGLAGEVAAGQNCPLGLHANSSVVLQDNWLIFDRKGQAPEPGWQRGDNRLMNDFSRGKVPVRITGNRIVNMRAWGLASVPAGNAVFADRPAAGLAAYPALPNLR